MYRESQKIHIIEEVLKVEDKTTLDELKLFSKLHGKVSLTKKAFMIL